MFDYEGPDPISDNIRIASNRLCYNTEEEVIASFVETGMAPEQAFLIVKAGKILLDDKYYSELEDGAFHDSLFEEECLMEELWELDNVD